MSTEEHNDFKLRINFQINQQIIFIPGSTNAFTYYWQVKNFNVMLSSWQTGRSMRSSTFYAGRSGYALYLKITPKYFPDGTVFVGVGLTRGHYDSILAWPFPHKIRLEVRTMIKAKLEKSVTPE